MKATNPSHGDAAVDRLNSLVMLPQPLIARVKNGRLVLDEPTDLPEGEELYLVPMDEGDELDDEERAALHRSLERGIAEAKSGQGVDAEVLQAKLRARRT